MKKLQYGEYGSLMNDHTMKEFNRLTGNRPTTEADLETIQGHKEEVIVLRNKLKKITKHLNRLIVIDVGLEMTIKMREHIADQMTIFEFGHNDEDEDEQT